MPTLYTNKPAPDDSKLLEALVAVASIAGDDIIEAYSLHVYGVAFCLHRLGLQLEEHNVAGDIAVALAAIRDAMRDRQTAPLPF